jgi:hypothetical protein
MQLFFNRMSGKSNELYFINKLNSIESNLPLLKKQIHFLKLNPTYKNNETIEVLISTCEFIPRVLRELLNGEGISL